MALEELLGIRVKEGYLTIHPRIPETWKGFQACWTTEKGVWKIDVSRGTEFCIRKDGKETKENAFPLSQEGIHHIEVILENGDLMSQKTSEVLMASQKTDLPHPVPVPEEHLPIQQL